MAVASTGQLARASTLLRRSASAIARSLTLIEDRFSAPLMSRSAAGFGLTRAGELVAGRCRAIETELAGCRDRLRRTFRHEVQENAAFFRMQMDISHMKALLAVQEFGSVQRAANYLSVSQPAVSYSIRLLESDIGTEIFSRTPRGMITPQAGSSIAVTIRRVLSELARMTDDVKSSGGISTGLVVVGGLPYSRSALLPETIRRIVENYPGIVVRTVEGPISSLLTAMHSGEIDLAIGGHPEQTLLDGVSVEPIARDRMGFFVAANHPLAGRHGLSLDEVSEYPFILPPAGSMTRDILDELLSGSTTGRPLPRIETSSYSIIRKLLISTDNIAFRSLREFAAEDSDGRIIPLDLAFELPSRTICLLKRGDVRLTSAVQNFLEVLHDVAGQ
jgi:LysR family transcriptional regulator of gallate degradation